MSALIDVNAIEAEARKQINEELTKKAKDKLVSAFRELAAAEQVVVACKAKIADLKVQITDGTL